MAILYITATTGTGTGTLRDCVTEAAEGDIIQPDPTLFPAGTLCTCSTATAIAFNKSLTIRGAQTRIQLVGGYHSINATSSTAAGKRVVFEDVDFIKGSRTSVAPLYVQYIQYVDFIRCRFMGNALSSLTALSAETIPPTIPPRRTTGTGRATKRRT